MSNRKDEIKSAYRSLGKAHSFYDGMMTGSNAVGRLMDKAVWNMTHEEVLEWTDLDTVNKTVSVNKSVRKTDGKNIITTPKTKSSVRTIRINDDLVDLLLAMKDRQIKSKYIFPSPETGEIRDTSAVTRKLHRIQERAGLPKIRFPA